MRLARSAPIAACHAGPRISSRASSRVKLWLVGAAVVEGGVHAINWGGIEHWRPVGVFGILIALALSPVLGGVAALLLAAGQIDTLAAPTWAKVVCAAALTAATALGGWRIIATVVRRIYRIRPEEGLASQTASAGVIFGSSLLDASGSSATSPPASTGVSLARRRPQPVGISAQQLMALAGSWPHR